jgi:hypothetical protein
MFTALVITMSVLFLLALAASLAIIIDGDGIHPIVPIICLSIATTLALWLSVAGLYPWRYQKPISVKVATVDNCQCITFKDHCGNYVIKNVNKEFGRIFKEGTVFNITLLDTNMWYGGINMSDRIIQPKIELVEDNNE